MFKQHLPPQWQARAPRSVRRKDGSDVWVFEGAQIPNIGLNAVVGRPPEDNSSVWRRRIWSSVSPAQKSQLRLYSAACG